RRADTHVAGAYPVPAPGDAPRRRRRGRAGPPAHRRAGRSAAPLPVRHRENPAGLRTPRAWLARPDPARLPVVMSDCQYSSSGSLSRDRGCRERAVLGLVQEHLVVEVLDPGFEAGWAEAAAYGEGAVGAGVDGGPEHFLGVALAD